MDILLVGGSGFVGKNLYASLKGRHNVSIMSRHMPAWISRDRWVEGDITKKDSLAKADIADFDVVVDLVAVIGQKEQMHRDVNVLGTSNLIEKLKLGRRALLVYFSAINSDAGSTEYFRTKSMAEGNVRAYGDYLIIRPSLFYGPGDYITTQLAKSAQGFIPAFPRSKPMCPVYIMDFDRMFREIIEKAPRNAEYNVCSNEMLTMGDMLNLIRKSMGKGDVPQVPLGLFKALGPMLDAAGIISREQLSMLGYSFYRDDTVLYRYIKRPVRYAEFVAEMARKGFASPT